MHTTKLSALALVIACFIPLAFMSVIEELTSPPSPRRIPPGAQITPNAAPPDRQAAPVTQARRPYIDYQDYDPNEYPPWFGYGDYPAEPPYLTPPPQDPPNVVNRPPYPNPVEEDQGTAEELPLPRGGEGGRGGKMDHPGSPGHPGHPGRPEGRDGYSGYGGPGGFGGYGGHRGLPKTEHGVGKRMLRVRKGAH